MFKMTYNPKWEVHIDGIKQNNIMISPSFNGVMVEPGEHIIEYKYTKPIIRKLLLGVSFLVLLLMGCLKFHDYKNNKQRDKK